MQKQAEEVDRSNEQPSTFGRNLVEIANIYTRVSLLVIKNGVESTFVLEERGAEAAGSQSSH